MHDLLNLIVDLRTDRFDAQALAGAVRAVEGAGLSFERAEPAEDSFLAWIDECFGGFWSSEAFAGTNLIARADRGFAGFATIDARGMKFAWLRGAARQPGVGIFGPFGVAERYRGSPIGRNLLYAGLCALREAGYAHALIPAVGEEQLVRYYTEHAGARIAERFPRKHSGRAFRTAVLASGSGSNFQSVIDNTASGQLPLELVLLLSNKSTAYAIERARASHVPAVALPWDRASQSRGQYDADLLEIVRREEPDLVLLLGWMHLLADAFICAFPETINIHPAFLPLDQRRDEVVFPDGSFTPAFRGAHAVRDALAFGSRWAGASSHHVTLDADRGPVLARRPLSIDPGEAESQIMERLHPLEHEVLAAGIRRWSFERS